LYQYVLT